MWFDWCFFLARNVFKVSCTIFGSFKVRKSFWKLKTDVINLIMKRFLSNQHVFSKLASRFENRELLSKFSLGHFLFECSYKCPLMFSYVPQRKSILEKISYSQSKEFSSSSFDKCSSSKIIHQVSSFFWS